MQRTKPLSPMLISVAASAATVVALVIGFYLALNLTADLTDSGTAQVESAPAFFAVLGIVALLNAAGLSLSPRTRRVGVGVLLGAVLGLVVTLVVLVGVFALLIGS